MLRRKQTKPEIPPASKYDQFTQNDLINCIEAEIGRSAELFRGLTQPEVENEWVLGEMRLHLESALLAIQALQRRVASVQSL